PLELVLDQCGQVEVLVAAGADSHLQLGEAGVKVRITTAVARLELAPKPLQFGSQRVDFGSQTADINARGVGRRRRPAKRIAKAAEHRQVWEIEPSRRSRRRRAEVFEEVSQL